jgi:hypothetical protein
MHIEKFIERIQGFDARGAKDFIMPMKDAKGLHSEITRLLSSLERFHSQNTNEPPDSIMTIEVQGKAF